MKSITIKNKLIAAFALLTLMSQSSFASGLQVDVSQYKNVAEMLNEGTEVELSASEILAIKPWAHNTNSRLRDLVESISGLEKEGQYRQLRNGVSDIVIRSAPQSNETLMRYALNRALFIDREIMEKETNITTPGILDLRISLYVQSIELALDYYKHDIAFLSQKQPDFSKVKFADFGFAYSFFLTGIANSTFDASAQYQLERINIAFLHLDLKRDFEWTKYSPIINKIHNRLRNLPKTSPSRDQESLANTRQIKKLIKSILATGPIPEISRTRQSRFTNPKTRNQSTMADLIKACGRNGSTYLSACIKIASEGNISTLEIAACSSGVGSDSSNFRDCVSIVANSRILNQAHILACITGATHSYLNACLRAADQNNTKPEQILACEPHVNDNSSYFTTCVTLSGRNHIPPKLMTACGSGSSHSYFNSCLRTIANTNICTQEIFQCSQATADNSSGYTNCVAAVAQQKRKYSCRE